MRYFIGFLITVGLIILLIVLLVSGGNDKAKVPATSKTLESYAGSQAVARITVDGPINSPSEHKSVRISVNRDSINYEEYRGYDYQAVNTQTYPNTENSYRSFLRALELAGFTKGNTASNLKDERGRCPLGNRYVFEFIQNGKTLERYWATNCKGPESFTGNRILNTTLFKRQVPNYLRVSHGFDLTF